MVAVVDMAAVVVGLDGWMRSGMEGGGGRIERGRRALARRDRER